MRTRLSGSSGEAPFRKEGKHLPKAFHGSRVLMQTGPLLYSPATLVGVKRKVSRTKETAFIVPGSKRCFPTFCNWEGKTARDGAAKHSLDPLTPASPPHPSPDAPSRSRGALGLGKLAGL